MPPTARILTPPSGSHLSGCVGMVWTETDGSTTIRHDSLLCPRLPGPLVINVCSKPDRAGNIGCTSETVTVDPDLPTGATFRDTDHDGRIAAVGVQLSRPWSGALPSFDISYGGPGQNTRSGQAASFGSSSEVGTLRVIGGDTVRTVEGQPLLDAQG